MRVDVPSTVFWLICIGVVFANAAIFRSRAARYSAGNPRGLAEARGIVNAFVIYTGGLCVLQAVGDVLGLSGRLRVWARADSVTAFDVFLLAVAIAVFGRGTLWVFGQGGAEVLARHHEMFNQFTKSITGVKILWGAMVAGVLSGMLMTLFGPISPR
jgi:hypothetical protein